LKNQQNEIEIITKNKPIMITTILIMTILNSLILVAFLVIFFSIKDAHQETMLYLTKNTNSEEEGNPTFDKLKEDIKGISKRIDNIEVKPLHNSTLIEQLKSEMAQLKNEILLQDTEDILIQPSLEYDEQEELDMDKIWDRFRKDKRNRADRQKRKLVKSLLKEQKEKKKKDKRKDNKGRGIKKFVWTDDKVSDFANNYNTKSIKGCENVKDKVEYYKQKNK
tara:strand:- start:7232 stop:7897 length:666 start_codon:yes stop_codon:yes gene_type:complete